MCRLHLEGFAESPDCSQLCIFAIMLSLPVKSIGWAPWKTKCTPKITCWGLTHLFFGFARFFYFLRGSSPPILLRHTKGGSPKSSIFMGFSIINQPFWGSPTYGNPHAIISRCLQLHGVFSPRQGRQGPIASDVNSPRLTIGPQASLLEQGMCLAGGQTCFWELSTLGVR